MTGAVERKAWSKYLQNEWRYDKWGALGKILVIQEVLSEEAVDSSLMPESGDACQKLANEIFPRTFYCERRRTVNRSLAKAILRYYDGLAAELADRGLGEEILRPTVLEETAEKFCLPMHWVREITEVSRSR